MVSVSFEENNINKDFTIALERLAGLKKIYLNEVEEDSDLKIKILDHKITRYSSALGAGARTEPADRVAARLTRRCAAVSIPARGLDRDLRHDQAS